MGSHADGLGGGWARDNNNNTTTTTTTTTTTATNDNNSNNNNDRDAPPRCWWPPRWPPSGRPGRSRLWLAISPDEHCPQAGSLQSPAVEARARGCGGP